MVDMERNYYGFVYETINLLNGKKYIGKCVFSRKNDWRKYLGSGTYFKRAVKKYGKENFKRDILFLAKTPEELEECEELFLEAMDAVNSSDYYNLKFSSIGGDVFTYHPEKERIRESRRKQMSGKGNHQYGKPKSEKMINAVKEKNSKPIEIDGIRYASSSEAARAFDIGVTTILYRVNSKGFPNYKALYKGRAEMPND